MHLRANGETYLQWRIDRMRWGMVKAAQNRADQVEGQQRAQEHKKRMARIIGPVLARAHVPDVSVNFYVEYAVKLDRLKQRFSCLTLVNEAMVIAQQWLSRGLEQRVLDAVSRRLLGFVPHAFKRPCVACASRPGCRFRGQPV